MRSMRPQTLLSGFTTAAFLVSQVWADTPTTLIGVLQSYSQLSTLYSFVNSSGNATSFLSSASGFTFLAPSNDAIQAQYASLTGDTFEALLQYALLDGGYSSLSVTDTPQFAHSALDNASYANVTGGQAVALVLDSSGTLTAVSGNKTVSTATGSDIVVQGGIIHIMDELLTIPESIVSEITDAGWEYFVDILNLGGYLSAAAPYVNSVLGLTDVTAFIPNSQEALNAAQALSGNTSSAALEDLFQYHVVTGSVLYSTNLTNGMKITTAEGANLTVTIQDGDTYINSAKITTSNYIVANGVVHLIDGLLNPNETYARPAKPTATAASTATSSTATSSTTAAAVNSHKSHSHGKTIGIAVGVTLGGLLILGALIFFVLRSRRRSKEAQAAQQQQTNSPNMIDTGLGRFYYVGSGNQQQQQHQRASQRHSMVAAGLGFKDKNALDRTSSKNSPESGAAASPVVPPRSPSRREQSRWS